ncbi:MAG: NAD(P)/FAD-dependent oxidoreductase [Tissierellia bacterium]|nr:NAD(P)/FAD-dependent oxidoreductase [Tissierellia bacterium]
MKVAVIGGGPAGILAGGFAGNRHEVHLFEKNEKLGKKLYITGKGRCNLTNKADISEFFDMVVSNKKFLYSAFYSFTNEDLISLIEKYGVQTMVERGNRVYPASEKSSDILKALVRFLEESKVNIHLNTEVISIEKNGEYFFVKTKADNLKFNKVIIATGGVSYPVTGSTGDGLKFSKNFGINTTKLRPGLTPIICKDKFISSLEGVSLKNVQLTLIQNGKKLIEEMGEALFTDNGISGPIALTLSSYIDKDKENELYLDFKPAMTYEEMDARLIRDLEENSNKDIGNALINLTTRRLVPVLIERAGISLDKKSHQVTKEERRNLVQMIKKFPLNFKELDGFNGAIITRGGVDVKEIDSSTMESKKIKGLYYAGEVLDLDALTGGFNLQIAFSTGYLAGVSC